MKTWCLAVVFVPALAAISFDPVFAKTVDPGDFGGFEAREFDGSKHNGAPLRHLGLFDVLWDDKPSDATPVVPPAKAQKGGGKFAGSVAPAPVGGVLGILLKGGATHRKAVWPALDFTGSGKRRGGSGGSGSSGSSGSGGGGGWTDGPPGGDPIDGGQGPTEVGGDPTQGSGGQGDPFQDGSGGGEDCDPISPVPLPAAGWLMMTGLGGLAALGRRRSKA